MALLICSSQFQSTPPRGWRHQLFDGINHITQISIHSTARVETPLNKVWVYLHIISIHSTARVETDEYDTVLVDYEISIHSTARVETAALS